MPSALCGLAPMLSCSANNAGRHPPRCGANAEKTTASAAGGCCLKRSDSSYPGLAGPSLAGGSFHRRREPHTKKPAGAGFFPRPPGGQATPTSGLVVGVIVPAHYFGRTTITMCCNACAMPRAHHPRPARAIVAGFRVSGPSATRGAQDENQLPGCARPRFLSGPSREG